MAVIECEKRWRVYVATGARTASGRSATRNLSVPFDGNKALSYEVAKRLEQVLLDELMKEKEKSAKGLRLPYLSLNCMRVSTRSPHKSASKEVCITVSAIAAKNDKYPANTKFKAKNYASFSELWLAACRYRGAVYGGEHKLSDEQYLALMPPLSYVMKRIERYNQKHGLLLGKPCDYGLSSEFDELFAKA